MNSIVGTTRRSDNLFRTLAIDELAGRTAIYADQCHLALEASAASESEA